MKSFDLIPILIIRHFCVSPQLLFFVDQLQTLLRRVMNAAQR